MNKTKNTHSVTLWHISKTVWYICFFTLVENAEDRQYFYVAVSKSKDFLNWEEPVLLKVKGDIPESDMGRMIDPYILDDGDKFICFFKQNGVSFSTSNDLINWNEER